MTTRACRWPVVAPAALALVAAVELAAYVLFAPVTTTSGGTSAGALAAGNVALVAVAAAVVAGAAVGLAAAVRSKPRFVWLSAAGLALVGVAGIAVGPQVFVVALLLVLAALLAEATTDEPTPRRNGTGPAPSGRLSEPSLDGEVPGRPTAEGDAPPRPPDAELPGDEEPTTPWTEADGVDRADGGPDREVVLAAVLLVPLAALLGLSAVTTPVARAAVAATAAVVLGGAGLSVWVAARS